MPRRSNRSTDRKFAPELCSKLIEWLRFGNFRESACRRVKLSDRTFRKWVEKGNAEIQAYETGEADVLGAFGEFVLEVEAAETEAEQTCVGLILASEDTADQRWFLERRYPKRWGKAATRVELSGPDGGAVKIEDARDKLYGQLAGLLESLASEDAEAPPEESDQGTPA